jgi:spore coat polysaccharide biosynthesis predicted glycosyltransferase SpsG
MDLAQEDKLQNHNVDLTHTSWLGATQKADASLCIPIMEILKPDWLIIHHYALDVRWEKALHPYCKQIMVTGGTAPWIKGVRQQAQDMPWTTEVVVGVNNMAELMAKSDLAIGAAGSTS